MEQTVLSINNNEMTTRGELIEYPAELSGGRNLFKPFNDGYAHNHQHRQIRVEGSIVYWKQLTTSTYSLGITIYDYDTYSRDYTFSYKTNAPVDLIRTSLNQGGTLGVKSTIEDKGDYRYVILKFTAELTRDTINWYGTSPADPIEEFAFWDFMFERGNKATDWTPAPEDVQAEIDEAIVKATYWSVKSSSPVIYKNAPDAIAGGTHTSVTVSGELRSGTTTTQGGFITVTPNGGIEPSTATASPVTISPSDGDAKTSYTVRLYDTASKTTLLDTLTIPVVFKGASGINAINVVLSNEAHVLPALPEGTVPYYSGSGTTIRVFEGATELDYDGVGAANGKFNVNITVNRGNIAIPG